MNTFQKLAEDYSKLFRIRIIPVGINKVALVKWRENEIELDEFDWRNTLGIAAYNCRDFVELDFDKCNNQHFFSLIAEKLGVTDWLIRSGSGNGYHLAFALSDLDLIYFKLGEKAVYKFKPQNDYAGDIDHLELRLNKCYTILPPSLHRSGNRYKWFNDKQPTSRPGVISEEKLLTVLNEFFILNEKPKSIEEIKYQELDDLYRMGSFESHRHWDLSRVFGYLIKQQLGKSALLTSLKNWDKLNKPPMGDAEIEKQFTSLWANYSRGNDGEFIQFENCLLSLPYSPEEKLKRIICYSYLAYGGFADKCLSDYGLLENVSQYEAECKGHIEMFLQYGKQPIIRTGKKLLLDALSGSMRYQHFAVYCGIVSYLGRTSLEKRIAYSVIGYRAAGFKNLRELNLFQADHPGYTHVPLTAARIKTSIKYLDKKTLAINLSTKKGTMLHFSIRYKSHRNFADYLKEKEIRRQSKRDEKLEIVKGLQSVFKHENKKKG